MKKVFVTITLGVVLFATAACGSSNEPKTEIGAPLTIERETTTTSAPKKVEAPTTTTFDDSAAVSARIDELCMEGVDQITTGLDAVSEGLPSVPYVDRATAREFLATANELVDESITLMESCVSHDPIYKDYLDSLYDVQASLKDVADTL